MCYLPVDTSSKRKLDNVATFLAKTLASVTVPEDAYATKGMLYNEIKMIPYQRKNIREM